jgi:glycosyltransferase involved in cell wall biosynthesis
MDRVAAPTISVVMPCHNAAASVGAAIESVLAQTYPSVELVVVDDGSTDASCDVLHSFGSRIVAIAQENRGPGPARNRGIAAASGALLAFLDADDYWRDDCLARLSDALLASDADIAYCGWQNVGAPGGRGEPYIPPDYEAQDKVERFLAGCPWPIHACLLRTVQVRAVGGFDERWSTSMDYDLWLRLATRRRLVRVPEVLAFYRHHGETQITRNRARVARNHWRIQRSFVRSYPEAVAHLGPHRLRELIEGEVLRRAYTCFWARDLAGAQAIFRLALRVGGWGVRDVKYLAASLLPSPWFRALVAAVDGAPTEE